MTSYVCSALKQARISYVLLDTSDNRGLTNIGRFDWRNAILALQHGLRFIRLLIRKRPQVVYVPISQNTLGFLRDCLFLIPARLARRKVVIHLHGSDFGRYCRQSSPLMQSLIRWTLQKARRAIVLGEGLRGVFAGLVPEEHVVVIPYGIRAASVEMGQTAQLAAQANGHWQIVFLGNLMKAKGFMDVLRSAPLVVAREPSAHFILAGEHCYPDEIREACEFINRYHLHDVVAMPGVVTGNAKDRLLSEADVFVFPPIAPEGQPLVILEAMSAGLPVIATSQGAISETVVDGETGFIVPPGDPDAIAEKILLVLSDQDLRRRMGRASRERFFKYYTLDRWANDMAGVFQTVLEEK